MGTHLTSLGGLKIIHFVVNIIQILEMLCLTTRYHFQLWQSADANFANLFCPIKKKALQICSEAGGSWYCQRLVIINCF